MKNLTDEEEKQQRANWELQQSFEYEERLQKTNDLKKTNPELFESDKVVVFQSSNLADDLSKGPTARPNPIYEESLIIAQYGNLTDQALPEFKPPTPSEILDPTPAAINFDPSVPEPEPEPVPHILAHDNVLKTILDHTKKIKSFRQAVSGKSDEDWKNTTDEQKSECKLSNSKYQIIVVDHVQQIAATNKFNICHNNQSIYVFNGSYWKKYDNDRFSKFLGLTAAKMGVNKFIAESYLFRDQLLKQFYSSAYLPEPEIDKNKVLINLKNGTYEIKNGIGTLRPFNSKDFITYQLPFEYTKGAKTDMFMKYLNRVLPDKERQRILAEYIGYVFVRHGSKILKTERAMILFGTGANGKSVMFHLISAMLGNHNVSSFSMESLTDSNGYYRAMIDNKLLNYASEISTKMDTNRFKQLVSGEPIEARHPNGRPMQLEQYAKLMFNCNELPKNTEQTNAFFRRFLIVPFDVELPRSEWIDSLHELIIENELSGFFNWVLSGLERLIENKKFSECKASDSALQRYQHESDNVSLFLDDENYKKTENFKQYTDLKLLYGQYTTYCNLSGCRSLSKINFAKRLQGMKIHFRRGTAGVNLYGITTNSDFHI